MMAKKEIEVSLDIEALYKEFKGADLSKGSILPTIDEDGEYYDLYNEYGELACMTGEVTEIVDAVEKYITFRGEEGVYFMLTKEELAAATPSAVYKAVMSSLFDSQ